jgi:uncharacterized protein
MKLRQPLTGSAEALFEYATEIPTIDTHEHIPRSEKDYNEATISFGHLFNPYVSNDLASAGMPFPPDVWAAFHCIEDDWDAFEPYWNAVKHGSYARPLRIALQHFYGVDDLTRENHSDILAKINENNTPGIYERIFRDACGIEHAIRCAPDLPDNDDPILVGNITSPANRVSSKSELEAMAQQVGAPDITTLDELIEVSDMWMELQAANGAIEFKSFAMPVEEPVRDDAEEILSRVLAGETFAPKGTPSLSAYIREANARKAAELDLPLALHTGVWNDFRKLSVEDLVGFIERNPDTRMDIYHLGIPEVRTAVQIVKNYPNAYMNLCWAHVVASDMVVNTMKEAMDMVPMNKIFAFGADYVLFIEKVYGHLHMARENTALVLGDRVDRNLMDLSEAQQILRGWFYDNPKAFYRL